MKKMKYVKLFEYFHFTGEENGQYLKLEITGDELRLSVHPSKLEEVKDMLPEGEENAEGIFMELFEDIQANSCYDYVENLGNVGFGLTEAPGILCNYDTSDKGGFIEKDDSHVYFYNSYMVEDFVRLLANGEVVIFNEAK